MTKQSRILVVEDGPDLAALVRNLLEFEGHAVELVHTGTDGMAWILSKPYDLVVLDWDLPGVSGLEILSTFRATGALTPVIMLTGKDTVESKEIGLDSGADDYLTKPFNLKELAARVRAHLRRGSAAPAEVHLGEIILDSVNHRASRGGRTHALPPAEYQILEFAAKYPHIKPTLAQLAQSIWPHDSGLSQSSEQGENQQKLQNAIRRLRKKFDPAGNVIFPHLIVAIDESSAAPGGSTAGGSNSFEQEFDAQQDLIVGLVINGKYELTELIGGGGSGLVYRGRHLDLNTDVAIKLLHLGHLASYAQSDNLRRFQREARVAGQLMHPNIVAVRDFGLSEQNQPYLVMELVEGTSLAEILDQGGQLSLGEILDIFVQACAGLEHAHQKGLIHRDLKPSNFMLVKNAPGRVLTKIVDFGLARPVEADLGHAKITQTGHVLGSPPYMSPEQCRGETVDLRSDIYSLGCALYEALQGKPPFSGSDPVEILVNHVTAPPPTLSLENEPPAIQSRINEIVQRCLSKEPQSRYQSAAELATALSELARSVQRTN